jgi:hypothetical protein
LSARVGFAISLIAYIVSIVTEPLAFAPLAALLRLG